MSRIRNRRGKEKDGGAETTEAEDVLVVRDALNGTSEMSTEPPSGGRIRRATTGDIIFFSVTNVFV
ncbi:BnaA06g12470D [Brassica napus]|uniref:BnaA06g12470D protein n=1 Tax=Brassica napus TaxID=3708 RepID=A0A078GI87_BRANA|nr:BnaA06g12470D [Brassica napus]